MNKVEELGDREQAVLQAIVKEYITTGGPIGSSQLARRPDFDLSPATMRNVMADLEELGLLEKPHTSAGRVPTDRGYRFYVDTLLNLRDPTLKDRELIEQGLKSDNGVEETLQDASKLLHFITRHAGVVLAPRPSASLFHRIELIRLKENRILAVLVSQSGQVKNKVFTADFPIDGDELVSASNYLTELLTRAPFEEVRGKIISEMETERALYSQMISKSLRLGYAATHSIASDRVMIEGAGSFLETPEFADFERARSLFRALEEKTKLLSLLDQVQRANEMQIYIGTESEFSSAGDVTVIATPYGTADHVLGTIGVIGPTRMNYQRVIPLVNFTAQVLSKILQQ